MHNKYRVFPYCLETRLQVWPMLVSCYTVYELSSLLFKNLWEQYYLNFHLAMHSNFHFKKFMTIVIPLYSDVVFVSF